MSVQATQPKAPVVDPGAITEITDSDIDNLFND